MVSNEVNYKTLIKSSTEIKISPTMTSVIQTEIQSITHNTFSLEGSRIASSSSTGDMTNVNVNNGGYSFEPALITTTEIKISTLILERNTTSVSSSIIQAVSTTAISTTSASNTITLYQVSVIQEAVIPTISPVIITNFNFVFMSVTVKGSRITGTSLTHLYMLNADNDCILPSSSPAYIDLRNSEGKLENVVLMNCETGGIHAYGGRVDLSDTTFENNKLKGKTNRYLFNNAFFEHGTRVVIGSNVVTKNQKSNLFFSTPTGDSSTFSFSESYSLLFSPVARGFNLGEEKFIEGNFISCDYIVDILKDNDLVSENLSIAVSDNGDSASIIDLPRSTFNNPGTYNFDFKHNVGKKLIITRVQATHVTHKRKKRIEAGAIAAIVISVVFVVAAIIVIALVAVYFHQKKKHALALSSEDIYDMESSSSSNAGDSA